MPPQASAPIGASSSKREPIDPTLGPALRTLRTLRGLPLRELAAASGSTAPNLSRYERSEGCPKHTTIVRILKALDLPYSALLRAQALVTDPSGVDDGGPDLDLPARVPPDVARRAAVELAQEVGRSVAHVALAFMELQAGGWRLPPTE